MHALEAAIGCLLTSCVCRHLSSSRQTAGNQGASVYMDCPAVLSVSSCKPNYGRAGMMKLERGGLGHDMDVSAVLQG
jgi:hypothetical protein